MCSKAGQPASGAVYFISDAGAVNEKRLPSVYFISEAGQPASGAVYFISDAGAVNEERSPSVYFISEAGAVNEVCILEISV